MILYLIDHFCCKHIKISHLREHSYGPSPNVGPSLNFTGPADGFVFWEEISHIYESPLKYYLIEFFAYTLQGFKDLKRGPCGFCTCIYVHGFAF